MNTKMIRIGDLFTEAELKAAQQKYLANKTGFHKVALEIVRPLMSRIEKATGQENDERYIAYMLEFVVSKL